VVENTSKETFINKERDVRVHMSYYDKIQEKIYDFMLGAQKYANARRSPSGSRVWDWIDSEDFMSLRYYRPFFRTVEGINHTMFVIDIDTKIPEKISSRLDDEEEREIKLRALLGYMNVWFKNNKDYKFTSYISGTGLYLVQKINEVIDKRNLEEIVWSPPIDSFDKYDNEEEDRGLFKACIKKLKNEKHVCTSKCNGWHKSGLHEVSRYVNYMGIEVKLIVDLHMYNHKGYRLFRAPYSPYVKLSKPYRCIPLVFNEDNIDIKRVLRLSERGTTDVQNIVVYPFQFYDRVELKTTFETKVRYDRKKHKKLTQVDYNEYKMLRIPEPEDTLTKNDNKILTKMKALFSDDPTICPPCIYKHYIGETDKFWSKMVIVRYLANKGFSLREVALFIRFVLNDEEDNNSRNRHKLFTYLPLAFGKIDKPHRPPSCAKMTEPNGIFQAVTLDECETCGRRYPLQDISFDMERIERKNIFKKVKEIKNKPTLLNDNVFTKKDIHIINKIVEDEKKGFERIREILTEVLNNKKHSELIKTTRCGVTTTLIHLTKEQKKRMLVVAPTNAIAYKTFPEALEFGKRLYGLDINGAIMSSNVKSCLKLSIDMNKLFKKKKDNPEWGEAGVRFNDMTFHFKPPCVTENKGKPVFCKFYEDLFDFPHSVDDIPYPVGMSEITQLGETYEECEGLCAYNTIMNNLINYDVLFITYDKLNAILSERSDETKDLLNFILNEIDVLFFDEISFLAQKPKLVIPLINENIEGVTEEFLDKVKEEATTMGKIYKYEYIEKLLDIVGVFIGHLETVVSDLYFNDSFKKSFSYKIKNPLDENERDFVINYFGIFHTLLEKFTKEENIYLENLEKFVILMQEKIFYLSNHQTLDYNFVCTLTCSPILTSIRNFSRQFAELFNKQVLVTDATMPYIKMSDLLGLDFKRVIVGDPRGTNNYQLIVADTKRLPVVTLVNSNNKMFGNKNYMELYEFINNVCETHNEKDVMVVLPNSGIIFQKIKSAKKKGMIPKKVQLTYYRSDKTIGVATKRRVMIAVCTPYPPKYSYIWLANYYKDIGLYKNQSIEELSEKLENMNAFQTFYQTIGRVKDPSNRVNSIVYLYGIREIDVNKLLEADKDIPKPKIVTMPREGNKKKTINLVGTMWKGDRKTVSESTLKMINYLDKRRGKKIYLSKIFNDLKLNKKQVYDILNTDRMVLNRSGIMLSKTNRGTYIIEMENELNISKINNTYM